jgi:hypothetical protein
MTAKLATVAAGDKLAECGVHHFRGAIVTSLAMPDVIPAADAQILIEATVDAIGNATAHNLALNASTVELLAPITPGSAAS